MADADDRTFSQRYGYEPLPEPMRLEKLSDDLRREIWNIARQFLKAISVDQVEYEFSFSVRRLMEQVLGRVLKKPEDEIRTDYLAVCSLFKQIILAYNFNLVLDLIETVLNEGKETEISPYCILIAENIRDIFENHGAAYRLDVEEHSIQFFPRTSEEQGKATQRAIQTVREGGMKGAETHLREAAKAINKGDKKSLAQAVADSIHAVESVARLIDPNANRTLTPALRSLKEAGAIKHHKLMGAFSQLYDYTNDEQGIRHALLEKDSPDVELDEAVLMFGACAVFSAYLVNKCQKMNRSRE